MRDNFPKRHTMFISIVVIGLIALAFTYYISRRDYRSVQIIPYPDGKDFAFTFIDDTDYSFGPEIEPVYDYLYSNGFRTTKTVWIFNPKRANAFREEESAGKDRVKWGASLEDNNYLDLVRKLHDRGFEIVLHGVSAGNDLREEIICGYEKFRQLFGSYPKMDILHAQNIENLYSGQEKLDFFLFKYIEKISYRSNYQGHTPGSKYFWGDISQKHVKYIRLPFHTIGELNILKINPNLPFHDPKRQYVNFWFPATDAADYSQFMMATRTENVDRLIRDGGTAILYTHFANQFVKREGNEYHLKEGFRDRMDYISKKNGWFVTTSNILDRFLDMKNIRMIEDDKRIVIVNSGVKEILGFTLRRNGAKFLWDSAGRAVVWGPDGKMVLNRFPAGSSLTFYKVPPVRWEETAVASDINRWERLYIEFYNYIGMILKKI